MDKGKYIRLKVSCLTCKKEVSENYLDLHLKSKQCKIPVSLKCEFCRFISKIPSGATLHKKVCQRNPNKILHPLIGTIGKPCSEQHKEILRNLYKTKKHPRFGGYQKNAGHSKKFKVLDSLGVEVSLQSSYEKLMQEWLDSKNIIWNRPSYLRYDDKKYFPDFYLPEYDIYIDTKNEYLAKIDKPKLDKVIEQCNVNILLVLKNEINDSLLQRFTPVV